MGTVTTYDSVLGIGALQGGVVNSFTPNWDNVTIGSGTQAFEWTRIGPLMVLKGCLTFAADTSFDGAVGMTIPDGQAVTRLTNQLVEGVAHAFDTGTASNNEMMSAGIDGNGRLAFLPNGSASFVNATNPFTWATGDRLAMSVILTIDGWS